MSSEEQDAAIGRLIRERTDANKERALVQNEISKLSTKVDNLWGGLRCAFRDDPMRLGGCLEIVDAMIAAGGLDRLKALLSEQAQLSQRISGISETLKKAGAE